MARLARLAGRACRRVRREPGFMAALQDVLGPGCMRCCRWASRFPMLLPNAIVWCKGLITILMMMLGCYAGKCFDGDGPLNT